MSAPINLSDLSQSFEKLEKPPLETGANRVSTARPWINRDNLCALLARMTNTEIVALQTELASVSGSGVRASVDFAPGQAEVSNRRPTWSGALSFMATSYGLKSLLVDDSAASAEVPAGIWDLTNISLAGSRVIPPTATLRLLEGAVLTNLWQVTNVLILRNESSAPAIVAGPGISKVMVLDYGSSITSAPGAAPLLKVPNGSVVLMVLGVGGQIGDGVTPAVEIEAGGILQVLPGRDSQVSQNSLTGAGIAYMQAGQPSAQISTIQPGLLTPLQVGVTIAVTSLQSLIQPTAGVTVDRPSSPGLYTGTPYFDTTLGIPIWWNGSAWVNAAGVIV